MKNINCAAMLVINDAGKILCVYTDWENRGYGLPCGKVDDGETTKQAAIRELFEETGFKPSGDVQFILMDSVDGAMVHTFITRLNGEQIASDEGLPSWEEHAVLLRSTNLYHKYNASVLKAAGII